MKHKLISWEHGKTNNNEPCIMAIVLCIPNWFARLFKCKRFNVKCCGIKEICWRWYYVDTGKTIPTTTYATCDDWCAGKLLGDFLEDHRRECEDMERRQKVINKIINAKKV